MNWWKKRRALKQAKELLAMAGKLLRMHRDILQERTIQELAGATEKLAAAIATRNIPEVETCTEKLDRQLSLAFPRTTHSSVRENIEVFLVAAIVAMGVRTFFLQPFKIPTGSMQPTLYGITGDHGEHDGWSHEVSLPKRLGMLLFQGQWPTASNAKSVDSLVNLLGWTIFGQWPNNAHWQASGDHIFVDRFTYHFRKPKRAEVVVFETGFMSQRGVNPRGGFYIKRLVGLAEETVSIKPPHVLIDGKVAKGTAFDRMYSMRDGYWGYMLFPHEQPGATYQSKYINSDISNSYTIPAKHFLALGDNSGSSLDGRYWGAVPEKALVGRAVLVYWPFSWRFGLID